MKYELESTLGAPLYYGYEPYLKVVNNGCIIETQDNLLIAQLAEDEQNRQAPPIDWYLFKVGRAVLTDNYGNRFACTMNNNGQWIRMDKLIDTPEAEQ